jgi:hypothetical protein
MTGLSEIFFVGINYQYAHFMQRAIHIDEGIVQQKVKRKTLRWLEDALRALSDFTRSTLRLDSNNVRMD